ncbi:MAG: hypothetical protein WCF26_24570 [Candidatus Sulfotelmatobacter sp.]
MRWSFDNPDPSGLSFNNPKHALDIARQITQDAKNWHIGKNWNPAKGYAEGHINIVLTGRIARHLGNYDLVLSAIPCRSRAAKYTGKRRIGVGIPNKLDLSYIDSRLNNGAMFMGISELVQAPQGRIPSFVRLELHKKRLDFWRDVLGFGFEVSLEFLPRISERERGALPEVPRNGRAGSMIQRRSQVLKCRNRTLGNGARHSLSEADFVNIVGSVSITLSNSFVHVQREKKSAQFFQVLNVVLCPSDTFNGTGEFSGDKRCASRTTARHTTSLPREFKG